MDGPEADEKSPPLQMSKIGKADGISMKTRINLVLMFVWALTVMVRHVDDDATGRGPDLTPPAQAQRPL